MTLWSWKAPIYSGVRRLPLFGRILRQESKQLARLLQHLPHPIQRHLDLGTGTGDTLPFFPPSSFRVCVDFSPAMLQRLPARPKLQARADHLPFRDHSFDFVSAIGLLEYIENLDGLFDELGRVLVPGGFLIFTSSPPTLANYLRSFLGERLYFRDATEIHHALQKASWQEKEKAPARTWLQEQWVVQK